MDFLGVGPLELIFVLIIALLVIGPRDIGKTAKTVGRFLNRVYKSDEWRALTEASRTLRTLPNRLAREAELEELKEIRESFKDTAKNLEKTKDELIKDTHLAIPSTMPSPSNLGDGMKAWTSPPKEGEVNRERADDIMDSEDLTDLEES